MIARKYLQIPATLASSKRVFSQGSLIISKLRNGLNKETFKKIICLKSQGVFIDKEEEEEKKLNIKLSEEENQFIININAQPYKYI